MTYPASAEARILTSAAFRRARLRAGMIVAQPDELVALLHAVEAMRLVHPRLAAGVFGLDLDIVCSVVEAHLETSGLSVDDAPDQPASVTATARLRLVVAALLYLVDADDAIPDAHPDGLSDDVLVLHWASRMARAELPAVS